MTGPEIQILLFDVVSGLFAFLIKLLRRLGKPNKCQVFDAAMIRMCKATRPMDLKQV